MKLVVFIFALILSGFYSNAQKIKYKDLYVLLRAKNYKDASSFLNTYITANPEHPNANYQMGIMLQFKIDELDLLKEFEAIIVRADSAIMYFERAYAYITPKEVKKHDDDYYEFFKRRNLRTGKFQVILSDVQLDIDNRKNLLDAKKVDVNLLNLKFNKSVVLYELARTNYQNLRNSYIDELSLSMGAADSILSIIDSMILQYDSALRNFKDYKKLKRSFMSSSGEIIITNESITDFMQKALRKPDFYNRRVSFYNFSEWGTKQLKKIEEHKSLIDQLIEFDESLENLANRIAEDSVDLSSEVFKRITSAVLKELKSTDAESLMMDIFQYKISQLNYNSTLMNWYGQYADTLDVGLQLDYVSKLKNQLEGITRLEANLHEYDELIFILRYNRIVKERYVSKGKLFNYITSQVALVKSQKDDLITFLTFIEEKDKWAYWNQDSLSLSLVNDPLLTFSTFYSDSLENRVFRISGLTKKENKNYLFFVTVPSSRLIDSLYVLETTIESIDLNSVEFIVQAQYPNSNHIVYLIGKLKGTKYDMQLVYIHHTNGIIWHNSIKLDATSPPQLKYIDNRFEIIQGDIGNKYQVEDGVLVRE